MVVFVDLEHELDGLRLRPLDDASPHARVTSTLPKFALSGSISAPSAESVLPQHRAHRYAKQDLFPLHPPSHIFSSGTTSTKTKDASPQLSFGHPVETVTSDADVPMDLDAETPSPNINGFSAALSCYPVVTELARSLDLNSLHALASTCRQFRANLLPFKTSLVRQTLRCANEAPSSGSSANEQGFCSFNLGTDRMSTGKVGVCARDMVGECRRCARIVCRNCTMKPPSRLLLQNRVRRICLTCHHAPLSDHTAPAYAENDGDYDANCFTAPAYAKSPCSCEEAVWICAPCGYSLHSKDVSYRRTWTWRSRYSTYLGGLGTGIGEGNQGVKCGREQTCLGAQEIEVEVECGTGEDCSTSSDCRCAEEVRSRDGSAPGYFSQEILGIGGVVKKKVKKRVKLGATVAEHEDERDDATPYLEREASGRHRAWCAWCCRVIPGKRDREGRRPSLSSASSSSSCSYACSGICTA